MDSYFFGFWDLEVFIFLRLFCKKKILDESLDGVIGGNVSVIGKLK